MSNRGDDVRWHGHHPRPRCRLRRTHDGQATNPGHGTDDPHRPRHDVDKQGKSHEWGSDTDPSAGYIAWLLWGGDEGKAWADRQAKSLG